MMRRISSLLTCFLVLTFSIRGSGFCEDMARHANLQNAAHQMPGSHAHHSPAHSDSQETSNKNIPSEHCQNSTTCSGVVFAATVLLRSIDPSHVDLVVQLAAIAPESQAPALEPPPPKA